MKQSYGQIHGNGKEDGTDVARRDETGVDKEPVDVRLRKVSKLQLVYERKERIALLCYGEEHVQRGDEGLHLPDLPGYSHDWAYPCILLYKGF